MNGMKWVIGGVVILVGALAVTYMTGDRGAPRATPHTPAAEVTNDSGTTDESGGGPTTAGEAQEVQLAPDFELTRLDGNGTITLADYRGEKPVIIDFWASWCPNCQRDMPRLSAWYDEYGDRVEVIGINLQEKTSTVQNYVDGAGISFPIVLDPSGAVSQRYGVSYTNTHVLINKEGSITKVIPGDIQEKDILNLLEG